MEFEVRVTLPSNTPVVGCELNPWVQLIPPNHSINFTWYHSNTSNGNGLALEERSKFVKLSCSRTYVPKLEDLGFRLRLESVATDSSTHFSSLNVIVTDPVITSPAPCPRRMISVEATNEVQFFNSSGFSVLSYNVLAHIYASKDIYNYCPTWALTWEYRRQNLRNEIIGYNADILCLQEVQSDHFQNFFKPELEKCGYSVIYKKKTKEVYTENQYTTDGCATFFRRDKFKEIMKYEIEFDKSALSVVEALEPCERNAACFRLMKGNIALVAILEAVENHNILDGARSRICVVNTHIHGNSYFQDAKLFQVVSLIMGLEEIACHQIPLLICGDMNSRPASDPYRFLIDGKTEPVLSTSMDPFGIQKRLKLYHSMHLASVYSSLLNSTSIDEQQVEKMNPETKEPKFTSSTHKSSQTIDYIFYSEDMLMVDSVLELLDDKSLRGSALPSPLWSSDHIALMASFRFKPGFCERNYSSPPPNPWERGEAILQTLVDE